MSASARETGDRPLAGRHVVVTRPPEQAGELAALLEAAGARVTALATIGIAPLEDTAELDAALRAMGTCDWVVLTSVNGVRAVDERLRALGLGWLAGGAPRFAVIGPATALALERASGRRPDVMPEEYVAEAVAAALGDVEGRRILLLRADIARRSLAEELRAKGADVREVAAYRTVVRPPEPEAVRRLLADESAPADVITCTSSSTVQGLVRGLEAAGLEPRTALRGVALAAIGPVTARTLREHGLEPAVVAADYTMPGLVRALIGHYRDRAQAGVGEGA